MIQTLSIIGILMCVAYLINGYLHYIKLHKSYIDPNKPDYNLERMLLVNNMFVTLMTIFFFGSVLIINQDSVVELKWVIALAQLILMFTIFLRYAGLSIYKKINERWDYQ